MIARPTQEKQQQEHVPGGMEGGCPLSASPSQRTVLAGTPCLASSSAVLLAEKEESSGSAVVSLL